jgi:hypothetical protein
MARVSFVDDLKSAPVAAKAEKPAVTAAATAKKPAARKSSAAKAKEDK